jgi:hypothetical protein
MKDIKYMAAEDFRRLGFLQEANRKFFHPLGLALEVVTNSKTGDEELGGIWDYRKDPEGNFFGNGMIKQDKIDFVEKLRQSKIENRIALQDEYNIKVDDEGIQVI